MGACGDRGRGEVITGAQRLRQIDTKIRIMARRQLRELLAGKREFLPCIEDERRAAIIREFDRLTVAKESKDGN